MQQAAETNDLMKETLKDMNEELEAKATSLDVALSKVAELENTASAQSSQLETALAKEKETQASDLCFLK